jgi:hypothetical protein
MRGCKKLKRGRIDKEIALEIVGSQEARYSIKKVKISWHSLNKQRTNWNQLKLIFSSLKIKVINPTQTPKKI